MVRRSGKRWDGPSGKFLANPAGAFAVDRVEHWTYIGHSIERCDERIGKRVRGREEGGVGDGGLTGTPVQKT